jgi:hypothetical protein
MKYQKLVHLRPDHKEALDEIQERVKQNGGSVSAMRLINDSIQVFIDNHKEEAIKRYSPIYTRKSKID